MDQSKNHPINCGLFSTENFARTFSKQTIENRSVDISYVYEDRIISPSESIEIVIGDTIFARTTESTFVKDVQLTIFQRKPSPVFVESIESSDASVFEVNPLGGLGFLHVNNGTCVATVNFVNGETYVQKIIADTYTGEEVDIFDGHVDGSLINTIKQETESILTEENSPLSHYAYYSTYDTSSNTYLKNAQCWFSDFDLSGVCVKTGNGNTRMCSLISPSFALGCQHDEFHPRIGETVVFVSPTNETITRVVSNVSYLNSTLPELANEFPTYDIAVIKFSSPLPNNIKKYKVLPNNSRYFANTGRSIQGLGDTFQCRFMPIICVSHYRWDNAYSLQRNNRFVMVHRTRFGGFATREERIAMGSINPLSTGQTNPENRPPSGLFYHEPHPLFPNYNGFPSNIRGGDSGGPSFAILNNDLILLGGHINSVTTSHFGAPLSLIQEKMNQMGSNGEAINSVDLTNFTLYNLPTPEEVNLLKYVA